MSAVDFRDLYRAFDALDERDSLRAVGSLDRGPDPVRHYAPDPAADVPAPSRSWSQPIYKLCESCGRKSHLCVCSSTYEELP